MKFQKTINLWAAGVQEAIIAGTLKLQIGQWVQCGQGPKARFVGVSEHGTFWVAHSEGKDGCTKSFPRILNCWNGLFRGK